MFNNSYGINIITHALWSFRLVTILCSLKLTKIWMYHHRSMFQIKRYHHKGTEFWWQGDFFYFGKKFFFVICEKDNDSKAKAVVGNVNCQWRFANGTCQWRETRDFPHCWVFQLFGKHFFFVLNRFFQNCSICFSFGSLDVLIYLGDMMIGFKESGCIADYTIF